VCLMPPHPACDWVPPCTCGDCAPSPPSPPSLPPMPPSTCQPALGIHLLALHYYSPGWVRAGQLRLRCHGAHTEDTRRLSASSFRQSARLAAEVAVGGPFAPTGPNPNGTPTSEPAAGDTVICTAQGGGCTGQFGTCTYTGGGSAECIPSSPSPSPETPLTPPSRRHRPLALTFFASFARRPPGPSESAAFLGVCLLFCVCDRHCCA